ncbi:MAG: peptidoglycan hydrolase FlgJ [Hyphomicrobiales bacterium]|jgi:Rod binding domain-containing protein|nr:peptidoglycan hydrolase FlgJ [Hyphomicrobiales bacterium]
MSASAIGPRPALAASTLPPSMTTKLSPGIAATLTSGIATKLAPGVAAKARATATDFEQVFLNSMFSQMFTGVDGEGPFGGSKATGVWRSFLTDEYAKSFAKAGGIGLGDHVYRALIAQQEARSK